MRNLTFDPPLGHITTFGGHPVSCAAGLTAQRVIEEKELIQHALDMEIRYRSGLRHPLIREVRGRGLFLAVVLEEGMDVGKFITGAFENGLIIDRFLYSDVAFRVAPPLIISKEEVSETIDRILATLNWMLP
jgi:4-aminobutyrate aminotransferase-like enzyme